MAQNLKLQLMLKAIDKITKPLKSVIKTAEQLRGQMIGTNTEIRDLSAQQTAINQYRKLQKNFKSTHQEMAKVRDNIQAMGRAISATETPTRQQLNNFETARRRLNSLNTAYNQQRQTIRNHRSALQNSQIDTRRLNSAEASLANRITQVNQRLESQRQRLNSVNQRTQRATQLRQRYNRAMQHRANMAVSGAAGVATGGIMLRGASRVIQPGINFEAQMSSVSALARVSKQSEQFKQLQDQAQALGISTRFSSTQAAQGMEKLAMSGFNANQIIAAMPGVLDLATAGNMELGSTADIASNILSAFQLPAKEMSRVSDVLAATFTRSNVDLEMLGETLKYTAPIAKTYGASVEEAAALTGLLGSKGIQGSMAGTAMRTMYSNIASHGPAIKALKSLGIATKDAQGNMVRLPKILELVAKKTENMGAGDRLAIFKQIAGKQAGAAFAALVSDAGAGGISKFLEILNHASGESKRIAKTMNDNLDGDLRSLGSAWESVQNNIYQSVKGPLRELIQSITKLTRQISNWIKAHPQISKALATTVAIIGTAIAVLGGLTFALAGILGPMAILRYSMGALGMRSTGAISLFKNLALTLWNFGKRILPIVGRGILFIGRALLMNPIGLAITGIAAAAFLIYKYWEPIKRFFSGLWQRVKTAFHSGIGSIAALIINWSPLGLFYKAFAALFKWFGIDLPDTFTGFGSMLINGFINGITNAIKYAKKAITGMGSSVIGWFKEKLGIHSPSRVFAQMGGFISQGLGQGIHQHAAHAIKSVKKLGEQLPKALPTALAVGLTASGTSYANQPNLLPTTAPITRPTAAHIAPANIQITIHAAQGMNEQAIAQQVAQEITKQQHQAQARQRSQLYDDI